MKGGCTVWRIIFQIQTEEESRVPLVQNVTAKGIQVAESGTLCSSVA